MEACPNPKPDCKQEEPFGDTHHIMWPASEYTTPIEKRFRALECNIVRGICRCIHNEEHTFSPPEKPSVADMRQAVWGHE